MEQSSFDPVNGADAAWLRLDTPVNPLIITALATIEPIEFSVFKTLIKQRFLAFPRFSKRPVKYSGVYLWEQDQGFSLDNHVKKVSLPEPADKTILQEYIGHLMSSPLDPALPLWQFILVDNYNGQHAVVIRVHHSYADGLSLTAVFGNISDRAPSYKPVENEAEVTAEAKPQVARQALHIGIDTISRAVEKCTHLSYRLTEESKSLLKDINGAKNGVRSGLNSAAELARLAALPSDNSGPLTKSVTEHKACTWSDPLPLATFKGVALHFGCSTNDVLLAAVGGGLRSYLGNEVKDVDTLRIHATLPVNLRPLETRAGREQLHDLGNQFGTVFVPIAAQIANPVERLYKVKHDMMVLKDSSQPTLSYTLMTAIGLMPGNLQEILLQLFSNKTSMVLSNVPGARKARYLAGSQVKELMFWVPQAGNIGLGISLLSYNGGMQIGVMSDRKIIPEPARLVGKIIESLQEYAELAVTSAEEQATSA